MLSREESKNRIRGRQGRPRVKGMGFKVRQHRFPLPSATFYTSELKLFEPRAWVSSSTE